MKSRRSYMMILGLIVFSSLILGGCSFKKTEHGFEFYALTVRDPSSNQK